MEASLSKPNVKASIRKLWKHTVITYAIFLLLTSLYLIPFMRLIQQRTDEGTFLIGALRIAHGEVFARDYFETMGPGTFYWLAIFFKLFGTTFLASRLCLFLTTLGSTTLMIFLSRRVCGDYWKLPCMIMIGTYYGSLWPAISHHSDSNLLVLLAVTCLVVWLDKHSNLLLMAAGILAGMTTFVILPKGALLLFAILIWLLIVKKPYTATFSALSNVMIGYVLVVAFVALYFWSKGALSSLIDANILWPFRNYGVVNVVPYAHGIFQGYWGQWVDAGKGKLWAVVLASILIVPFLFIAAVPLLLAYITFLLRKTKVNSELLLLLLCGGALWISELHRKDMVHLVFGAILLLIPIIGVLHDSNKKASEYLLQVLVITSVCLLSFNLLLVLTAQNVSTRVGSVAMYGKDKVLMALDSRVAEGEELFIYPYCPSYYFLSGTSNPTRYSFLQYNYNSRTEFDDAIAVLDRRKVRFVLWDTNFNIKLRPINFPSAPPVSSGDLIMEPYLETHYKVVSEVDGFKIMERNDQLR